MIDCSKFVETLQNKPIAVFGLGISGLSTIKALKKAGADIIAWDDNEQARTKAQTLGATCTSLDKKSLKSCAMLVLAPGVPLHYPQPHPVVTAARTHNLEIICDLEILHRCKHMRTTIGITGTNGKSTTTALINHILTENDINVAMGGNIGKPVLDLKMPKKDGIFLFEISSYQMDLCPTFRPDIAILLNITPDHIDRHGTFEKYVQAKARMFEGEGLAVIGIDDAPSQKIYETLLKEKNRRVRPVSFNGKAPNGVCVHGTTLYDARETNARENDAKKTDSRVKEDKIEIGSLKGFTHLRGAHNHQNAAAAFAACASQDIGLKTQNILNALKSFPGLPHRQYQNRIINGIPYINDSKATNVEAASKALNAYKNIYWIAGGRPKGEGLDGIQPLLPNIQHTFLIGEAMSNFATWLDQYAAPYTLCTDMQSALNLAHKHAQNDRGKPGGAGVVLLSPACASFDQYKSFEARGDHFTKLVMALDEQAAKDI